MSEPSDESTRAREIAHQHGRWQDDDGDTCATTAEDDCVSPEEEHHCGSCDSAVAVALAYGRERERAALGRAADHLIDRKWMFDRDGQAAARGIADQIRHLIAVPADATPQPSGKAGELPHSEPTENDDDRCVYCHNQLPIHLVRSCPGIDEAHLPVEAPPGAAPTMTLKSTTDFLAGKLSSPFVYTEASPQGEATCPCCQDGPAPEDCICVEGCPNS